MVLKFQKYYSGFLLKRVTSKWSTDVSFMQKTEEGNTPFNKSPNLIDRKNVQVEKRPAAERNSSENSSYYFYAHKNTKERFYVI